MKKQCLLAAGLLLGSLGAQAQYQTASIVEAHSPVSAGYAQRSNITNCHTYGNVDYNGNAYDLSVHSWDLGHYGPSNNLDDFGIAWRSDQSGTINEGFLDGVAIKNMTGNIMQSSDIAIVWNSDNKQPYVLVSYYTDLNQSFYLDVYKWDPAGNTMSLHSSTQLAPSFSGQLGWIHLDANRVNQFVVTWQNGGHIYAWAGNTNNTNQQPELSPNGAAMLEMNLGMELVKPDVALTNVNGALYTHFVCADAPGNTVVESRLKYQEIYDNNPAPNPLFPQVEDVYTGHTIQDNNLPRIDCPDNAGEEVWTWVISGLRSNNLNQDVIAHSLSSSGLNHYILNNGSLMDAFGFPLVDVSADLTLNGGEDPVVAYDNGGGATPEHVFFSWVQHDNTYLPPYSHKMTYVGYRMRTTDGQLDNELYWIMPTSTDDAPFNTASIALSGQNDASPDLYCTFSMLEAGGYFISRKDIPWNSSSSFRQASPASHTEQAGMATASGSDFLFYPNPAGAELHVRYKGDAARTVALQAADVTGRIVFRCTGTAASLENSLNTGWFAQAAKGMYLIRISGDGGYHQELKVIKQ